MHCDMKTNNNSFIEATQGAFIRGLLSLSSFGMVGPALSSFRERVRKWSSQAFAIMALTLPCSATAEWYAGHWDASIYNLIEKPRTVAVRIEVRDESSDDPVVGASVVLFGEYLEERIGTAGQEIGIPYEPQRREFKISAQTDRSGIAVFALSWSKEYPWTRSNPSPETDGKGNVTYSDIHTSWIAPIDDIEKIQEIQVRHSHYSSLRLPFNFDHILKVGQEPRQSSQQAKVLNAFDDAWHKELNRTDARFCVLDLGSRFEDYQNRHVSRKEFFERVRDKHFGNVFTSPKNWFSTGDSPQSLCGPYLVYLVNIQMQRDVTQVELVDSAERDTSEPRYSQPLSVDNLYHRSHVPDRNAVASDRRAPAPLQTSRRTPPSKLSVRNEKQSEPSHQEAVIIRNKTSATDQIGLAVETLTPGLCLQLGLYPGIQGVVIIQVASGSSASSANLDTGMVIESIDQKSVHNDKEYHSILESHNSPDEFNLYVWEKRDKWERVSKRLSVR